MLLVQPSALGLPEPWAEQGSAPTFHLALHVLLLEDQHHLLQQCSDCCIPLPLSLLSKLGCTFSAACWACSVNVQCISWCPFPKLLVTNPHRVSYCISLCNAGPLFLLQFHMFFLQTTSRFVLTVCNTARAQTDTCAADTSHVVNLRCSAGSVWVRWLRPAPTNQSNGQCMVGACDELLG